MWKKSGSSSYSNKNPIEIEILKWKSQDKSEGESEGKLETKTEKLRHYFK